MTSQDKFEFADDVATKTKPKKKAAKKSRSKKKLTSKKKASSKSKVEEIVLTLEEGDAPKPTIMKDHKARYIEAARPGQKPKQIYLVDIEGVATKDVLAHLEFPIFSVSSKVAKTRPKFVHNDIEIELTGSTHGLPTMYDKGLMIYIVSTLMKVVNDGGTPSRFLRLKIKDVLTFCKRSQCGQNYDSLVESLQRLTGTLLETNMPTGKKSEKGVLEMKHQMFHLLESAEIVRYDDGSDSRLKGVEVEVSSWLYEAVVSENVLTLCDDYFDLKPNTRRIYELARKHVGNKKEWGMYLSTLHKKSGSTSPIATYKRMVKQLAFDDDLPQYELKFFKKGAEDSPHNKEDFVLFVNRKHNNKTLVEQPEVPTFHPSTIDMIRDTFPGINTNDIYNLAGDFMVSQSKANKEIYNFESQFMGYMLKQGKAALGRK